MSKKPFNANRQIARAAGTVMLAFAFGQIVGLLRRVLVAQAFGAGVELDAFIAANRVSETLFNLVAGGALGSAFIPTFTGFLAREDKKSAWKLASAVANWVTLVLSLLAALGAVFAPQIVRHALAPGFSGNPAQFALTVTLLRIQLASAILFGLSGLMMGILNSHQVFLIPALTPSMYQLGMIFGVLVLTPKMGIYGLAWGVVIGALFHLVLQIPSLLKKRGKYSLTLGIGNAAVAEVIRLMGPRLLGVAVVQLNFWVNTWLASRMAPGSVAGIEYGFALMLMAQIAIAQSIATAAMPTFAAQYALGKLDDVRSSLSASIRGVILLSVPATVGLITLRVPLITLLYQRGEFDARSTEIVAWALLWYAIGLVGHSVMEILARAFYALHDTKTPVLVGIGAMSLNVVFSIAFAALFERIGWMPHGGLALANSLATALEMILLMILMRKRLNGLHISSIARGFGQAALAALGMGIALFWWNQANSTSAPWLVALGGIAIGGVIYLLGIWVLKVPEIQQVASIIRRRFS
ncbi:MAG: murein biosynthesis integral membrane protein MurJ [Anaerolineales bacterium]|uniref:Probable lipid II flippase MurJ n=1 Tax=Candidatus Desulfolinea nitratireducens TaxID=2841698 RepID=A0A8J6NKA7_9CHLR|nr:murein biosynthesis integral membrane protein MurJ [Candidatus Desulfolinea nitratireducens]MBL6960838.1 murein biosynthesis integral membrane protein MurJ [Anaerolineales bacterium]